MFVIGYLKTKFQNPHEIPEKKVYVFGPAEFESGILSTQPCLNECQTNVKSFRSNYLIFLTPDSERVENFMSKNVLTAIFCHVLMIENRQIMLQIS